MAVGLSLAVAGLLAAGCGSVRGQEIRPVTGSPPSEGQRVALVTGSTGGLGRELARRLAAKGDHVVVHGRDIERGTALVEEIEAQTDGSARFYRADFGSLDETRALAEAIRRDYDRLDILVNNAGILLGGLRRLSEDGHELHFQVNYLAHFLLTHELLPLLRASAPSRIVHVSSVAQQPIDFDDVMLENGYSDGRAYAQSKLAQILFTFDLAEALEGSGVTTDAVHPASLMNTDMVLERSMRVRSTVEEGADAVMHVVDEVEGSGRYFNQTQVDRAHEQAYDAEARARLRRLSQRLTGVQDPG
ncbi:MAG: SDR family NAD(P)-dependent oxidoreductase [Longimicrobiales bacterium]|nr:SDR family NAD(P)-dependent oxidoreductase [Longimicrobiales bacterium]